MEGGGGAGSDGRREAEGAPVGGPQAGGGGALPGQHVHEAPPRPGVLQVGGSQVQGVTPTLRYLAYMESPSTMDRLALLWEAFKLTHPSPLDLLQPNSDT